MFSPLGGSDQLAQGALDERQVKEAALQENMLVNGIRSCE